MTPYILAGIILILFIFAFKLLDGRYDPPAIIFILAYASATFLYAASILLFDVRSPSFAWHNFDISLSYAVACFAALFMGYILHGLLYPARRNDTPPRLVPLNLGLHKQLILVGVVLIYWAVTIINNPIFSGAEYIRGERSYLTEADVDAAYRINFMVSQTFAPFAFALFVISFGARNKYSLLRALAIISIILIVALTLLSFDRHQAMSTMLMVTLFYHYRVRSIRFVHIIGILLLMLCLQTMRTFRAFGLAILEMSGRDILDAALGADWVGIIVGPFVAIGGWDVLTNVFDLVPNAEDYKYGGTYFNSLVGIIAPRALGLGAYGAETPSVWYVNLYAPGTTEHGFDFSMLAESYINFGFAGFAVFILVGILIRFLSNGILRSSAPSVLIFFIIAMEVVSFAIRMDSNALVKGLVYKAGAVALLFTLLCRSSR